MKKLLMIIGLLMILCLTTGCIYIAPEVGTIQGIVISSQNNERVIKEKESLQLTVKVYPETADQTVYWSSDKNDIAVVNQEGLVVGVSKGYVNIVATSIVDATIKQSFKVIVEEALGEITNPTSIEITSKNDKTTCKVGETINLSAVILPKDANQSVTWTSSDSTIATVTRGVVTPLKEGTVVITANAKGFNEVKDEITLTFESFDQPVSTKDWSNMDFVTHDYYLEAEDETPLKVKGVVTHVSPINENTVTYVMQNGTEGYYIHAQNSVLYPIELGKVYEVGGFKKYYRGLNEIINIEYCKAIDENITYTVNKIDSLNPSDLEAMSSYHASFVTGKATFNNATVSDTKAYSLYANVNGYETTLRVDPSYMTNEEFVEINKKVATAITGMEFEFTGVMSAFGYGKPSPQILIVKPSDLVFAEISDEDLLAAASNKLTIPTSISLSVNKIELPTEISGFDNISVSWVSNSELINVETGVITHKTENVTVTLTATLSIGTTIYRKTFEVLVFAEDNNNYEVLVSLDLEDAATPNQWGVSDTKSGYAEGTIQLGTPKATWLLKNALIAASTNDKYDGVLGIRAKSGKTADETGRIEIQEDGEYNIIEFATAIYGSDKVGIQIKIEYSLDSGATWTTSNDIVTISSSTLEIYRIKLPEGVKRIAIVIVENTGNRVNIDNIKLIK